MKFFLDIFSGASMPVSTALSKFLGDRVQPIDLIHGHDLLHVLLLAASGLIGAALAAPYCSKHSKATLKSPGPAPVRTPEFIDGLPSSSPQQQLAVEESAAIHDRSRALLSEVDQHGGLVVLENSATSMTFDDPIMVPWIQTVAPFAAQASACQFGKDWSKTWMFVANRAEIFAVAKSCPHGFGVHQQITGVRMADGTFFSHLTAEYPQELADALATVIAPFVSKGDTVLPLDSWRTMLPRKLQWPTAPQRIEDGGGLPSTALHMSRPTSAPLVCRLSDTKQCLKIVAALLSGCKEPPLSQEELAPYIEDLIELLGSPTR